jgi:uncharacterized membrane protein
MLLGLIAGVLSGVNGIGGGVIIVPALVFIFGLSQHMAQGTTLALLVPPIGILAAWTYYREGYVDLKIAALICLGIFHRESLWRENCGESLKHPPRKSFRRGATAYLVEDDFFRMKKRECNICGKLFPENELISGHGVRREIARFIEDDNYEWNDQSLICKDDFNAYRIRYVGRLIEEEKGKIEILENDVIRSINENELITSNIEKDYRETTGPGDRIADRMASFGGSWQFIGLFSAVLAGWISINTLILIHRPFDPYPFILLNLILSCLAAIQAPVIIMSQKRQEARDRLRSQNDYKINLKSEIEIRTLHEKVDHLLLDQWSKMMRIQEIQLEILEEIKEDMKKRRS